MKRLQKLRSPHHNLTTNTPIQMIEVHAISTSSGNTCTKFGTNVFIFVENVALTVGTMCAISGVGATHIPISNAYILTNSHRMQIKMSASERGMISACVEMKMNYVFTQTTFWKISGDYAALKK